MRLAHSNIAQVVFTEQHSAYLIFQSIIFMMPCGQDIIFMMPSGLFIL